MTMVVAPWIFRSISWLSMLPSKLKNQVKYSPNKNLIPRLTTPEEKLKWIFNVFDKDGGGSIDAGEIQEMVGGLFAMAGVGKSIYDSS